MQCRKDDSSLIDILKNVNHQLTYNCILAERNILKILEGDCETAVGAFARIENNKIYIEAELFSIDGKKRFYNKASKNIDQALELGKEVGEILKKESKNSYKR